MDLEAFNEQQLDLDEIFADEHRDPRNQRMIVDTEEEAEKLVNRLEEEGFENVFFSFDDESNNYDVCFTSDHPLTDREIDEVLSYNPDCTYSFNIGEY